jgi:hypothetical protein
MALASLRLVALIGSAVTADPTVPTIDPSTKCVSLSERCVGKADTRATIPRSNLAFAVPAGWIYAQAPGATVAQVSDAGPAVAFLGVASGSADPDKAKEAAFGDLVKKLGLSSPKRKPTWRKPDDVKRSGALRLELWQLEENAQRGSSKGSTLVVAALTVDGTATVGLGFVPNDDQSGADAMIMKAVESLAPRPGP